MSSKTLVTIIMYLLGELLGVGTTKIWKTKLVDFTDLDKSSTVVLVIVPNQQMQTANLIGIYRGVRELKCQGGPTLF